MKRLFNIIAAILYITATTWAQSPEKMSYQAIIRNAHNALVANTQVGMQISILQTSADGMAIYTETHQPTTNVNGLVAVEIGKGTSFDDFAAIDWSLGPYFIKTETDPEGGTNYTITGVNQLLSVPYALHAKTAEMVTGGITETDPVYTASEAAKITTADITNLSKLSGTNTGDQDISGIAINAQAIQNTASQIRSEIPDVSGFLSSETQNLDDVLSLGNSAGDKNITNLADPVNTQDAATKAYVDGMTETDPIYTTSQAANITATDITNLSKLSGSNTGDQDISGIAINAQAIQNTASQIRSEIPDVSRFLSSETQNLNDVLSLGNSAGDKKITNLADPENSQDAATKAYVDRMTETDPAYTASEAVKITAADITNLSKLSGTNTGNQDISGIAINAQAIQNTASQIRSEIPDVSGFLSSEIQNLDDVLSLGNSAGDKKITNLADPVNTQDAATKAYVDGMTETDPIYTTSQAANITATDITNLSKLSGTNTGDQDISGIAINAQAIQNTASQIRSEIPDVSGFLSSETQNLNDVLSLGNSAGDKKITNLADPVDSQDAVTKAYVDHITETDPVYAASEAAKITATDIFLLGNLPDNISDIATNRQAIQDTAEQIRNTIPKNLYDVLRLDNSAGDKNITGLADPVDSHDAVTKAYVDELEIKLTAMENVLIDAGLYTLTDVDGNAYKVVKIGNQRWMAENLKTTKYRDGTAIPLVTDNGTWRDLSTPGYCWYDNDSEAYAQTYGALYNWYTVNTGNLCPIGWHVPTDAEWATLIDYLGGTSAAGVKLKETGTTHWIASNGSTNESGFTALPGGHRSVGGSFDFMRNVGYWWSATAYDAYNVYYLYVSANNSINRAWNDDNIGFSVRCIKD